MLIAGALLLAGGAAYLLWRYLHPEVPKSAVVCYGQNPSFEKLQKFDIVIVEPDAIDTNSSGFDAIRQKTYAYVSIGESEKNRDYYPKLKKEWFVGENSIWQSRVLDMGNPDYQRFMIGQVMGDLKKRGFQNFFFDTVDAYQHVAKTPAQRAMYEEKVAAFIRAVKSAYPDAGIILNRGFEIIDAVHDVIDGVLFESLFYGLSGASHTYGEVPEADRAWLMAHVEKIRAYGLPVIALDYLPPDAREKIAVDIKKIRKMGLIPYIGDRYLQKIGFSATEGEDISP
jgi:uncharacterized protein (TIGR01370 family)